MLEQAIGAEITVDCVEMQSRGGGTTSAADAGGRVDDYARGLDDAGIDLNRGVAVETPAMSALEFAVTLGYRPRYVHTPLRPESG